MQEAELIQKSAEPLPIRHNGGIRWQNDSYGSGCEGMAAAAATATVTALTACRLNLADMHNDIMHIVELGKATATAMVQAQQDAVTALTATATTATATTATATAAAATAVEGAVEERVLRDLTSEPIANA